ncbi:hypothetical protein [Amycolatopsis anabasis]|uniref:hypothetical protein n=1 Tax=Amycolatopsis anabasis TaxID=1840409 RepID=UPI00131B3092|nr:hypothetical protein [Amycolatopsis anabasis]
MNAKHASSGDQAATRIGLRLRFGLLVGVLGPSLAAVVQLQRLGRLHLRQPRQLA